jgi:hypothetical protein
MAKTEISAAQRARILHAIEQSDAIFALEGFMPTPLIKAIDAAVLEGRVTRAQVSEEIVAYATAHKKLNGFLETRSWAK